MVLPRTGVHEVLSEPRRSVLWGRCVGVRRGVAESHVTHCSLFQGSYTVSKRLHLFSCVPAASADSPFSTSSPTLVVTFSF